MAKYSIEIKRSAVKEIKKLPASDVGRIMQRIAALADDPRPPDAKKLTRDEKYRIRSGNYRILYEIRDAVLIVTVVAVSHR